MSRSKGNQSEKKQELHWELPVASKVWVYLRHSPGDNQTIESQQVGMHDWCERNGWLVEREFVDEGVEGSKEEREHFQEMMAQAKQLPRPVDGIAVWSFSRFARSQLDSQYYKADLRKRGYVVVSKIDDIPSNEMAPIFESVIDWKNQRFLEDLSADVKRGLHYVAGEGYIGGTRVPVGYRVEKVEIGTRHTGEAREANRLLKDEAVADRVALAWRMKLEQNASYREIHEATHLLNRQVSYSYFFSNLTYAGIFEFGGKRYPSDWQSGARFCEPYVTLDEFNRVQELRQQRTISRIAPRLLSSPYLLTGLLHCGICGRLIHGVPDKRTASVSYRCGSKSETLVKSCGLPLMYCWRIDEPVAQLLKDTVLKPDYVAVEIERANKLLDDTVHVQVELRRAIADVEEKRQSVDALLDVISKKTMTPMLEQKYDQLQAAWQGAEAHLAALRARLERTQRARITIADVSEHLDAILLDLGRGTMAERRSLIARFVDRIDVYPTYLDVTMQFRLDGKEEAFNKTSYVTNALRQPMVG